MLLKKIVVAEDDDSIAHLITMALGDAGFLCLRARDGTEAINLVRVHAPDLLVLDVMMPRLDGREVARKIKADVILSKTPILMLTALSSIDDKLLGFEAGADDYLVKPFDLREFGARVHALIRAARRERDRSPTTNLPGAGAIDDHLAAVLKSGEPRAVMHFDVRGFDAWADRVGFTEAEKLVAALGRLILGCTRDHEAEFVGHLGGVDFIAVSSIAVAHAVARDAVAGFERDRATWGAEGVLGLALVIAAVATSGLTSEVELASRLGAAMQAAKQGEGSRYVGPEAG